MKTIYKQLTSIIFVSLIGFSVHAQIIDEVKKNYTTTNKSMNQSSFSVDLKTIQKAFNKSDPSKNIRFKYYNQKKIYKLRLREMMQTVIVLPKTEKIASYKLGDKTNFHFVPESSEKYHLDNIATLWGEFAGADTNLTIIGTSGNIYSFYVRIDSVKSKHMPDFVFRVLDDSMPNKKGVAIKNPELAKVLDEKTADYLRSLPDVDVSKLNFNYSMPNGDESLKPVRIFDDGYWTYFQYSSSGHIDKPRGLPVLYRVVDGYDTPVNTRIENGMLIAETTSNGWTLRAGESHLCVRKESD